MKIFTKILFTFILLTPVLALAQYQTLVGIPGVDSNNPNFDTYMQAIYATSISLAALLAVIKIVIAGVKWMTTDIVSTKGDAKKDIEGAVLGLIVILSAVLILYIINPNIGTVDLQLTKPPAPPAPTEKELADRLCANRTGDGECTIYTCGDGASFSITCKEAEVNCMIQPTYKSVQMTGPNTLVCQTSNKIINPKTIKRITEALSNGSNPLTPEQINFIVKSYSEVSSFDVTNEDELSTIKNQQKAEDIYFAAKLPGMTEKAKDNLETICSTISGSRDDSSIDIRYDNEINIVSCIKKSI